MHLIVIFKKKYIRAVFHHSLQLNNENIDKLSNTSDEFISALIRSAHLDQIIQVGYCLKHPVKLHSQWLCF
jgi:hypothetical protein